MSDKLTELIERFQNGDLTAEEAASLEDLLRASPKARAEFVSRCLFEMQLYKAAALAYLPGRPKQVLNTLDMGSSTLPQPPTTVSPPQTAFVSRRFVLLIAGLAASILAAVLIWWSMRPEGTPEATRPAVVARVADASGDVVVVKADGTAQPAATGQEIRLGEKIKTRGESSWASLLCVDETSIDLAVDTLVCFSTPGTAESSLVELEQGAVQVHAVQQPRDKPLVFSTAHARFIVLGTKFRLYKEETASRVEMEEGKVRMVRKFDGREVEVQDGSGAVAAAREDDAPLKSEPLSREAARLVHRFAKTGSKIAFSPDGKVLAGNRLGHWKTWRLADGAPLKTQPRLNDGRFGFAFSSSGDTIVSLSEGKRLALADAATWESREWPLLERDGSRDGTISPDGRWLAVGRVESKMFLWSIGKDSIDPRFDLRLPDNPTRVALSRELATGVPLLAHAQWSGPVEVLDLSAAPPLPVLKVRLARGATHLALSDDGRLLATCSLPDGLQLWRIDTGEKTDLWTSHAARIESLRFAPDGLHLAAGLNDGTVRVWSCATGEMVLVLDAECRIVRDVAFSPGGTLLSSAGDNGLVKVWECLPKVP